ncbi:hypothetical protein ACFL4A_00410 [bacterium]
MFKRIMRELEHHAPFTVVGALSGIVIMFLFRGVSREVSYNVFYIIHPMHVFMSGLVTASMYELHNCKDFRRKCNIWILLLIGYVGAIGIATLSDSYIPYLGEVLLDMPHRQLHHGFIDKWWLINPLAILGIAIAYFRPSTRFPHSLHVLISTWASLFHVLMAIGNGLNFFSYFLIFIFLFLAVWLPCCISDIVFPLLFVKEKSISED